ncbi:glutamate--cysteine ligase [Actinoplanes campanulatus]|uniref:Glutamate--cysteine ligase EgtA n=1 Tax=Actinoplanes campanulatus TaxID=113559 RepID=A0A7W5AQL3_9ACTN|nr:ergothioneine biosynthesis glutamate--cysteine ligase EgtA [Actinoplanes campanulatus]MBB3100558.1 glutamate--cysteine ligase [Actinoplanes campanulatus]GGN45171.1 glutamate--cysteine ligase EgtA [Actinoplanes campanulatus]GID41010.1 glutamate--cysteine ligase EgtA [Actinoplanes campanulatus]
MGSADRVLRRTAEAIEHIAGICFKTGPPRQVGAELEWTTHRAADPSAYLRAGDLAGALGEHAPVTLGNPNPVPLPCGGAVTVEPGGQVEISSVPAGSLAELHTAVTADREVLTALLADAGIVLGEQGLDPYGRRRRLLDAPRYAAMERAFDSSGHTMMTATAGLQICLDAGEAHQIVPRWAALHEMGPALLALFANSPADGWASRRMASWYGIDPRRTAPVPVSADPAQAWAEYAVRAPLLCVPRPDGCWDVPPEVTFADWIEAGPIGAGPIGRPPTPADLEYHLGTLFPPVRPRGYLEVRYLDTQPGDEWIVPAAVLVTLLDSDTLTDRARELAAAGAGRWHAAARLGLADGPVRRSAADLAGLACRHLDRTGLPAAVREEIVEAVQRRLHRHREGISA